MATVVYGREIGDVEEEFVIVVTRREKLACSQYRTVFRIIEWRSRYDMLPW